MQVRPLVQVSVLIPGADVDHIDPPDRLERRDRAADNPRRELAHEDADRLALRHRAPSPRTQERLERVAPSPPQLVAVEAEEVNQRFVLLTTTQELVRNTAKVMFGDVAEAPAGFEQATRLRRHVPGAATAHVGLGGMAVLSTELEERLELDVVRSNAEQP